MKKTLTGKFKIASILALSIINELSRLIPSLVYGEQIWRFDSEFCQSEVRQFTSYYRMVYSQITIGNVTLPITLLSTK